MIWPKSSWSIVNLTCLPHHRWLRGEITDTDQSYSLMKSSTGCVLRLNTAIMDAAEFLLRITFNDGLSLQTHQKITYSSALCAMSPNKARWTGFRRHCLQLFSYVQIRTHPLDRLDAQLLQSDYLTYDSNECCFLRNSKNAISCLCESSSARDETPKFCSTTRVGHPGCTRSQETAVLVCSIRVVFTTPFKYRPKVRVRYTWSG